MTKPIIKDLFVEYVLKWEGDNGPEELYNNRFMSLIKYIKLKNIKKYKIEGLRNGVWLVIINH